MNQQLTKKSSCTSDCTPCTNPAIETLTIHCTPQNAAQMQQVVKNWPELHSLVRNLQEQNLFPGLRGLSITLTGSEQQLSKGLGALIPENAPKRD